MTDLPTSDLLAFVLASAALTGSPGPAVLSVAAAGAAFGLRRSLGYMAGLAAGMVLVITAVASGVTGLLLAVEGAAPVAALLAAAYIVYLAWRIATAPPPQAAAPLATDPGEAADARAPSFGGGVFLQLVNPKAYAAMTALFSGFVLLPGEPAWDALLKGALLIAIILPGNLAWALLGAALTRLTRRPAVHRAINLGFAALLVASVAFALLL